MAAPSHKKFLKPVTYKVDFRVLYKIRREYPQNYFQALKDLFFPTSPSMGLKREILYSRDKDAQADKIVYFAHYSHSGTVDEYVLYHLTELKRRGADIVFCSTSKILEAEAVANLATLCRQVIVRENVGFDFGSYCCAWQSIDDVSAYKKVVFTNDTVYGPFFDLDHYFSAFDRSEFEMFGMTDSYDCMYHVQSYFVGFKVSERTIDYLESFWARYLFHNIQRLIIYKYEFGLTRHALEAGLKVGAYIPYMRTLGVAINRLEQLGYLSSTLQGNVNPTHHHWRVLIEDFQFPFLKVDLISYNPCDLPDLAVIRKLIPDPVVHINMIRRHVERRGLSQQPHLSWLKT